MLLNDKLYDFMKRLVQVILPAIGTLYFALSGIWGLPAAENVVGTIVAITTFLGVVLGISTRQYNNADAAYDGQLIVMPSEEDGSVYRLQLNDDVESLTDKSSIRFKVSE